MSTSHYMPPPGRQPCWYCVHWAGPAWGDPAMADCRRGGQARCVANAASGCVHWMREVGVDDDGWAPVPLARPTSPERGPPEMTPAPLALCRRLQADIDGLASGPPDGISGPFPSGRPCAPRSPCSRSP